MKEKITASNVITIILLFLWGLGIIFPLIWILFQSLKTNQEFFQSVWNFPQKLQWRNYIMAWERLGIGNSLLNTIYYVGFSLVFGIFITAMNAYALTRLEFKGRKIILEIIMMSLFLPGVNALVPQYILMRTLGLTNSLSGLILLESLGENVFSLFVLSGFMQTLPKELEESAHIDGASIFRVFWRIILPLAVPGIVTVAIFRFIGLYNSFLNPFIYLSDPEKYTIGVNMYHVSQSMQYKADWVTLCAGVITACIPSIMIYILFQKQIIEGATLGSLKG
jgi:ABC-type glycerol-3-phosphate transport system permease component